MNNWPWIRNCFKGTRTRPTLGSSKKHIAISTSHNSRPFSTSIPSSKGPNESSTSKDSRDCYSRTYLLEFTWNSISPSQQIYIRKTKPKKTKWNHNRFPTNRLAKVKGQRRYRNQMSKKWKWEHMESKCFGKSLTSVTKINYLNSKISKLKMRDMNLTDYGEKWKTSLFERITQFTQSYQ